jgi:hypothetical protein
MKRKYCCDASRQMFQDYYMSQSGHGVPIFQGSRGQRGHGLGSVLSGFFRSAMPILKRGLAFFGREALKTGARIADDVAEGEAFGDATRKRVGERINEYVPGLIPQSGSGKRRRRITQKKKKITKRGDIFG